MQKSSATNTRLRDQWTAIYKTHGMPEYENDIPTVVKAIIDGPYSAFGGSSLNQVISFSVTDQYRTERDADRLGKRARPEASNTRILFAAASTVYARDPDDYGKLKMQQLVLDHVKNIRKAGVSGSQTTIGPKLGTLDKEDKEAGKRLFAMLAKSPDY